MLQIELQNSEELFPALTYMKLKSVDHFKNISYQLYRNKFQTELKIKQWKLNPIYLDCSRLPSSLPSFLSSA